MPVKYKRPFFKLSLWSSIAYLCGFFLRRLHTQILFSLILITVRKTPRAAQLAKHVKAQFELQIKKIRYKACMNLSTTLRMMIRFILPLQSFPLLGLCYHLIYTKLLVLHFPGRDEWVAVSCTAAAMWPQLSTCVLLTKLFNSMDQMSCYFTVVIGQRGSCLTAWILTLRCKLAPLGSAEPHSLILYNLSFADLALTHSCTIGTDVVL